MTVEPAHEPGRRGRPRAGSDPRGPLGEWLDGLSPTAAHIVRVARHLLVDKGYEAVTIEAVALEANVVPVTVRRLFVSKASLLHALLDRLQVEAYGDLVARIRQIPTPEERLYAFVSGLGVLIEDPSGAVGLTEVLAHGLRDPVMRGKIAAEYEIVRDADLQMLALDPGGDEAGIRRLRAVISLIVAVIDGLAVQVATDPDAIDSDYAFGILADMVRTYLAEKPSARE